MGENVEEGRRMLGDSCKEGSGSREPPILG